MIRIQMGAPAPGRTDRTPGGKLPCQPGLLMANLALLPVVRCPT